MSKYPTVKLGDVCEKASSSIAQKDIEKNNGAYPIYGASGKIKNVDFYKQKKEYIAIVKDGAGIGRTMLLPACSSIIGTMQYILPKEIISIKYLYYAITSMNLAKYFSGATIPHIYFRDYKNEILPLPNKEKQNEIVCILDKIVGLIKRRKNQLSKIDELAKSRFVEMFGDPNTNPFSYKVCRLNEITETKLSYGSGASSKNFDGELRYIRITDILESGDLSDDKKSPTNFDEKYLLNDGDILFARSGATVGKTYCYKSKDGKSIYAGYLIRLVPNKKIVYPEYICAFTKTKYYESLIQSIQRAVAQPNINAKEYGEFKIILPPLEKQAEYILFLQQLDKSKFRIKKSLEKLELTYKALLQEYFG